MNEIEEYDEAIVYIVMEIYMDWWNYTVVICGEAEIVVVLFENGLFGKKIIQMMNWMDVNYY